MGIAPITNLIPLQIARTIQNDVELVPMERVENSTRTADETYTPSNQTPPRRSKNGASEEEESGDDSFEEAQENQPTSSSPGPDADPSNPRPISFFA